MPHDDPTSSSPSDLLIPACAATAFCLGLSITLLQLDSVSRILLSPDRLRSKRRNEVLHRLETGILNAFSQNDKPQCLPTDYLLDDDELETFIKALFNKKDGLKPEIAAMGLDDDERGNRDFYLNLKLPSKTVQVPLVRFCTLLQNRFESMTSGTTLCFASDASSGLGTEVLHRVLTESGAGLAIVNEPTWMIALAQLIERRAIQPRAKLETILYALCRLEAWRLRDDVGTTRTVVFLLPGQITTPTLLPLLQTLFSCERHVFMYDTCTRSIRRALTSQPLTATAPLSQLKSIPHLSRQLKTLPSRIANPLEAWMTSVDTFLQLKHDDTTNEFLPFVLRMGFLMGDTNVLGHGDTDSSELALHCVLQYVMGSRSRPLEVDVVRNANASLRRIRREQRPLKSLSEKERLLIEDCVFQHKGILIGDKTLVDTVQPAKEWTLKSAKKIWGCACCAPEEEEEDEEEEIAFGTARNEVDLSVPGAFATNGLNRRVTSTTNTNTNTNRPKYVDGKVGFAFDPTKFSGGKLK